ncbi:MAG TPA: RIP metalloprotease RseP [Patescibacteria group bacterium]
MLGAVLFILVLSFLVIIHECGHFFAAKWAKVKVEEFGLGYPPLAVKLFTWKNTLFSLNWIPFGGFVRMEGEELEESIQQPDSNPKKNKTAEYPFYTRSAWQRLVVILAGVTVNFLFAFLAFSIYFTLNGIPALSDMVTIQSPEQVTSISIGTEDYSVANTEELQQYLDQFNQSQPRIGFIAPHSPAEEAQIPTNVKITQVQFEDEVTPITNSLEVVEFVNAHAGQKIKLSTTLPCTGITCPTETNTYDVYIRTDEELTNPSKEGKLGIHFDYSLMVHYPLWQMPFRGTWYGFQQALYMGIFILQSLGDIVYLAVAEAKVSPEVGGPIAIVDQANQAGLFERGALEVLYFMGMLSVNLAIINLLPIPALDGGRAVFILLEKVIGKRTLVKFEGYANYAGFVFLIGLMVLITARDLYNVFIS